MGQSISSSLAAANQKTIEKQEWKREMRRAIEYEHTNLPTGLFDYFPEWKQSLLRWTSYPADLVSEIWFYLVPIAISDAVISTEEFIQKIPFFQFRQPYHLVSRLPTGLVGWNLRHQQLILDFSWRVVCPSPLRPFSIQATCLQPNRLWGLNFLWSEDYAACFAAVLPPLCSYLERFAIQTRPLHPHLLHTGQKHLLIFLTNNTLMKWMASECAETASRDVNSYKFLCSELHLTLERSVLDRSQSSPEEQEQFVDVVQWICTRLVLASPPSH
jgi:hypothetical protein